VLPLGIFDDYSEVDLERSGQPRLSLGIGYAFLDRGKGNRGILGPTPSDAGTTDFHHLTADVLFKQGGVTALVEAHYRNGRRAFGSTTLTDAAGMSTPAPREAARDGYGWFAQIDSVLGTLPLDAVARYGQMRGVGSSSLQAADDLGAALAWSPGARRFRVQADYSHRFALGQFRAGVDEVRLSARLGI
jgi:phosphate-selective porin OprO and OprP